LVKEDGVNNTFNSLIYCGIFKNDIGSFATELQRIALVRSSQRFGNDLSDFCRAGEGNFVDVFMIYNKCAVLARPSYNVDDAFWNAGILAKFSKFEGRQGSSFCWFQHNGVTGGQSRGNLPCQHQEWKIPGYNLSGHTQWLGFFSGKCVVQFICPASIVEKMSRCQRDINIPRLANRLAAVQ